MKLRALATVGLFGLATATAALPALAQNGPDAPAAPPMAPPAAAPMNGPDGAPGTMGRNGVPTYTTWQDQWNSGTYDKRHVILGTVADFKPFRLEVSRADGPTQTIDLKQGTTILPTGMTPMPNQRVAVVGYYSNGTFIANRVILHG
jgi:hypothetical protein